MSSIHLFGLECFSIKAKKMLKFLIWNSRPFSQLFHWVIVAKNFNLTLFQPQGIRALRTGGKRMLMLPSITLPVSVFSAPKLFGLNICNQLLNTGCSGSKGTWGGLLSRSSLIHILPQVKYRQRKLPTLRPLLLPPFWRSCQYKVWGKGPESFIIFVNGIWWRIAVTISFLESLTQEIRMLTL